MGPKIGGNPGLDVPAATPPKGWSTIEDAAHAADLSKPRFPVAKTHAALWLKALGGSEDDLYFWEAAADPMSPAIKSGDLVLLHIGREAVPGS